MRHPIHPLIVHFPIAFLVAANVADAGNIADLWNAEQVSGLFLMIGVTSGFVAIIAGLVDFAALEEEAIPTALRHMGIASTGWLLYAISFMLRLEGFRIGASLNVTAVVIAGIGFFFLMIGGWLGGQLVYKYGAGHVHD